MNLEISPLKIDDIILEYRENVDNQLAEIYPKGPQSLHGPIHYVLNGSGKRLRPLLAIFVAEACGGLMEDVMSSALAIEVLHNFTLVHDDIMDGDIIRHGQETVHQKWDNSIAILTGDAMLSLALGLINQSRLSKNKQMKIFIEGLLAVCEGQALDKELETYRSVTIDDYIRMIDLKTGHIIGMAAQIGATSAGADANTINGVRDYGRLLGRAFQIQDDYLEIFSDSNNMGKSLKSDIILGKKTFLMISALEKNSRMVKIIMDNISKDFDKGMKEIREYMHKSGIQKTARKEINNIIKSADSKLSQLNINKDKLLYFSELIRKRRY